MTLCWARRSAIAVVISCVGLGAPLPAQGPPEGRGGRGATPQAPSAQQVIPRTPPVDPAAHDQGRDLWAQQCVSCHGTQARGSDTGPNIIRSTVVNGDRSSFTPGSVLGPFLKKGHPTQSGVASSTFTDQQIVALAHFLRQRVNETMRGSEIFVPGDVLTGDAKAGEAFFNGAGGCATCHNATTRSLAGMKTRAGSTVDVQHRMLFPMAMGRGRGRGRGAAATPNHAKAEYGPGVDMRVDTPRTNLDDPGVGLRDNGRRVLTYADVRTIGAPISADTNREIELHLTGHMERYVWSFNGEKFSSAEPLRLAHGERVRFVLVNDTMMTHPIHLHGMWSELETPDGEFLARKHTIVVQPAQKVSYRVSADAVGRWAYHCHLLYHMEAGMFREVVVA